MWSSPGKLRTPLAATPAADKRKLWHDTSSLWTAKLMNHISRHNTYAVAAWAHDAAKLAVRIRDAARSLRNVGRDTTLPTCASLLSHTIMALEVCDHFLELSRPLLVRHTTHLVSTPLARPLRVLGLPSSFVEPLLGRGSTALVVATFGWWEIILPTPAAVQALCLRLASVRAQVCIVMGLPATAVSEAADGRFGYAWVGEPHSNTGGVGIIVLSPHLGLMRSSGSKRTATYADVYFSVGCPAQS